MIVGKRSEQPRRAKAETGTHMSISSVTYRPGPFSASAPLLPASLEGPRPRKSKKPLAFVGFTSWPFSFQRAVVSCGKRINHRARPDEGVKKTDAIRAMPSNELLLIAFEKLVEVGEHVALALSFELVGCARLRWRLRRCLDRSSRGLGRRSRGLGRGFHWGINRSDLSRRLDRSLGRRLGSTLFQVDTALENSLRLYKLNKEQILALSGRESNAKRH